MIETRTNKTEFTREGGRIGGYAIVRNQIANINERGRSFKEVVPGDAIFNLDNVKLFLNHDVKGIPLASTPNTLQLIPDERGLRFETTLPESATREREAIERGDLNAMSFSFSVNKESQKEGVRNLHDVTVHEISIVNYPAYSGTSVGKRSNDTLWAQLELLEKFST
jgi:uncharacterized protein